MRIWLLATLLLAMPLMAEQTVYVAPAPQPGDANYVPYQLNQLGEILRRNEMHSAQLDMINAQADLSRALAESVEREEIDSLVSLAQLLDAAGTAEQKATLQTIIQQKLDDLLPATLRPYPPDTVLVFASPGYPWAAQQIAAVLAGSKPTFVDATLSEVLPLVSSNPNVVAYVEVEVNVHQAFENVKATCYRPDASVVWTKKTILNAGGSPERLARTMTGRLLKKVRGAKCP